MVSKNFGFLEIQHSHSLGLQVSRRSKQLVADTSSRSVVDFVWRREGEGEIFETLTVVSNGVAEMEIFRIKVVSEMIGKIDSQ
jgi:hypothetical protein